MDSIEFVFLVIDAPHVTAWNKIPQICIFFNSQSILVCILKKNTIIKIKHKLVLFITRNFHHVVEETECLKVYLIKYLTKKKEKENI